MCGRSYQTHRQIRHNGTLIATCTVSVEMYVEGSIGWSSISVRTSTTSSRRSFERIPSPISLLKCTLQLIQLIDPFRDQDRPQEAASKAVPHMMPRFHHALEQSLSKDSRCDFNIKITCVLHRSQCHLDQNGDTAALLR